MSDSFRLPLIGSPNKPSSSSLMPVDDAYMRRPEETAPKLFQLLPDSSHVPPAYTLAGGQSDHVNDDDDTWYGNTLESSHSATALYTPDAEPGTGCTAVTDLADTLTDRADRLPQPTVAEGWPHLYDHSVDTDQLVSDAKAIIAELTEKPTEYQNKSGAVLSNLVDRVQTESGITRQEVYKVLEILETKGAITRDTTGIIQPAGESQ